MWGTGSIGVARKNDRLFSSLVCRSSSKKAFSYKLCYSIDKKAHNNRKKGAKRIAEMKQMRTFVDENKRSFFLATPMLPVPHIQPAIFRIKQALYILCTRVH